MAENALVIGGRRDPVLEIVGRACTSINKKGNKACVRTLRRIETREVDLDSHVLVVSLAKEQKLARRRVGHGGEPLDLDRRLGELVLVPVLAIVKRISAHSQTGEISKSASRTSRASSHPCR